MAAAAVLMMGAGPMMGAQGASDEGVAKWQANEENARLAERNAALSVYQSAEEARRMRVMNRKYLGNIVSQQGASGGAAGDVMDVLQESGANAEHDALTVEHGGQLKAEGYNAEARLSRMSGGMALDAGNKRAAATLLEGAGSIYKNAGNTSSGGYGGYRSSNSAGGSYSNYGNYA